MPNEQRGQFSGKWKPILFAMIQNLKQCLCCTYLFLWYLQARLQQELKKVPKLQKFWNLIKKKYDKLDAEATEM